MKHYNRFIRWLKCKHKWQVYRMDDAMNPIGCGSIVAHEPLNPNLEYVRYCLKCSEVRTFGKVVENFTWI